MITAKEIFEILYEDELAREEAASFYWFGRAVSQIEKDIEDQNLVVLRITFKDGTSDYQLLPRFLAELMIQEIPFGPDADKVASAKLTSV